NTSNGNANTSIMKFTQQDISNILRISVPIKIKDLETAKFTVPLILSLEGQGIIYNQVGLREYFLSLDDHGMSQLSNNNHVRYGMATFEFIFNNHVRKFVRSSRDYQGIAAPAAFVNQQVFCDLVTWLESPPTNVVFS